MNRKIVWTGAVASALMLTLASCGGSSGGNDEDLIGSGSGDSCKIDESVPIGAAFSLTGDAAQYGAAQKNALELAAQQLSGDGIDYDVTIEDDETDPKQGIQLFEGFVNDGSSVIIGPTLSNAATQTDPVAQDGETPVVGVSNTSAELTDIGDYVFRVSLTEDAVIPDTIEAAKDDLDLEDVVVMYSDDDAFTKSGYEAMEDALKDNGVNISDTLTFSKEDTDFHAILDKVKKKDPDAIVVSALLEAAVPLVTQTREVGIKAPIVGGNGFNSPALIEGAGDAADGVIVGAAWNSAAEHDQNEQFINDYEAKFDSSPDQFAAQAYAGLQAIDDAIRADCDGTREGIKKNLSNVDDLPTVLGDLGIDENRDAVQDTLVQVIDDGEFELLN